MSELFTPEQRLNLEYVKACVRVAAHARFFAALTDEAPLCGLTFEQGSVWDDLTAALSVLDELEADADITVGDSAPSGSDGVCG